jgi:general secretion pathway protein B
MSFILDALKKSETDRQRQNGPALFEVRVAPTRDKLPLWAVGLGVLLAVNLVIVAWVLLRRPSGGGEAPTTPPTAATQPAAQASYGSPAAGPAPSMSAQQGPAYLPPATNAIPVNGASPTAPVGQTAGMTQPPPPSLGPGTVQSGVPSVPQGSAATDSGEKLSPDDVAPATDPGPLQPFGNHVSRSTQSGVPLYEDVAATTRLPTLRLDLHVYAASPQERFVMINMHKLHEGDALPTEGVRVESITPYGAVLSHEGTRFLLPRD